jgi:MscS family membrane protein
MNWRFKLIYRGWLALLLTMLVWSVWASARAVTGTKQTAAIVHPAAAALGDTNNADAFREDVMTFGLDRVSFLRERLFEQPLWKYFASLIFIGLAFGVAKLLDWFISTWLKRWAARTKTQLDDLLLSLLHGPIKVVAFVLLLHAGLRAFDWSGWAGIYVSKALQVVVACSLTYVVLKAVDLLLGLWRQRTVKGADKFLEAHLFPVIHKSVKAFIVVVAILLTADNLGIKITSLLAGLSLGGLALGLAAQDSVANLFGAVAIFFDKPFHIGDRVKLEGVDGLVEDIGMRSTRVRSLDGHLVTIPNKTIGNATITNVSRRPNIKTEMNIGIPYDTPLLKVKQALVLLDEIFRRHPQTASVQVSFNKFADSALNLYVLHFWNGEDWSAYLRGMNDLNLEILERFNAEGIGFAFPTQTLYLKQDSEWRIHAASTPAAGG